MNLYVEGESIVSVKLNSTHDLLITPLPVDSPLNFTARILKG